MAGILLAAKQVAEVMNLVSSSVDGDEFKSVVNSKKLDLMSTDGRLTKLLGKFTIEPIIIATKNAKDVNAVFDDLLHANVDMFASFYLQAFKIIQNVYGMDTHIAFDLLSSDTSVFKSLDSGRALGDLQRMISSEELAAPRYIEELMSDSKFLKLNVSSEAKNPLDMLKGMMNSVTGASNSHTKTTGTGWDTSMKDVVDDPLYGMLTRKLNVVINTKNDVGKHTIHVPVMVKAHVIITDIDNIINMLKPNSRDKGFLARFDEWRAGAIGLKELILCGDIIKEYRKNKIADKDGLINVINERVGGANMKTLRFNKNWGLKGYESQYNMIVMTSEDKLSIDRHIGGDIIQEKNKQQFLNEAHAMAASIVDQDYERVNILISDIRGDTDVGFKSLKNRKRKEADYEKLLNAMMANRPPVF